jgi:hypothetical protein
VISVDTKKKELVGDFKNAGREWRPQGAPEAIFRLGHVDPDTHQKMHEVVVQMADRGLRVLGAASYRHEAPVLEDLSQTPFIF